MKPKTYDWETCCINSDEWKHMIERRNAGGWRMVSASVVPPMPGQYGIFAYVFWESDL